MILIQVLFPFLMVASGQPTHLTNDTFDLTGQTPIIVSDSLIGPAVIKYNSVVNSDTGFVFKAITGAVFKDITFIGPNGDTHIKETGYLGCIRVWSTAVIENCRFINFDKWHIDIRSNRHTLSDTTYIRNCYFTGAKRDGYGYSIWTQYGTALIENCIFESGRHFIDGSSEGHRIILRNCSFDHAYESALHSHRYTDGFSGAGMDIINCFFGKNATDIDIQPPFPPAVHRIEGNTHYSGISTGFWIKPLTGVIATVGTDTIPNGKWVYRLYRSGAVVRVSGTGTCFIDDWIQGDKYYPMEDVTPPATTKTPKIKYVSGSTKADRSVSDQVSGDKALRLRLTESVVTVE